VVVVGFATPCATIREALSFVREVRLRVGLRSPSVLPVSFWQQADGHAMSYDGNFFWCCVHLLVQFWSAGKVFMQAQDVAGFRHRGTSAWVSVHDGQNPMLCFMSDELQDVVGVIGLDFNQFTEI
jgi:hypothetical protein